MFHAFHPVGENRIRESFGLDFEDFAPGQLFHHRPGITVTQQDNIDEALATLNNAMIHYDNHYADGSEFRLPLVVSTLTLQRAIGQGWKTFGRKQRVRGFRSIALTAPVFGGDTLYARSRILEVAAQDDELGLVVAEIMLSRQDRTDVARVVAELLIYRRGRGPFAAAGYGEAPGVASGSLAPLSHVETAPAEFVETIGIEFDDLAEGLTIEHRPGFTFSWQESRRRSLIAGDHSPVLVDPTLAAMAGGGEAAVSEAWIVGAFAAGTTRAFGRVVANLGWENIVFPHPVHDGDLVLAESKVLGRRLSKSRPDQGILHVQSRALNRRGAEVCCFERRLLIYRGAQQPHRAAGYV